METEQFLTTDYQWTDLVVNEAALKQITELYECAKKKKGCSALFHGPSGTGKTLSGSLLGKELGREVVRIDLSMVISKYIGETEKNLEKLFARAEIKNWILFFDEADALFGKRTDVKDAHDKYANKEVSYLLQRIEKFNGMVIFATTQKSNIDDAFIRRLRYVIPFPIPEPPERLLLWEKNLFKTNLPTSTIDLPAIASKFALSGAAIGDVVQHLVKKTSGSSKIQRINNDLIIDHIQTFANQNK